MAGNNPYQVDLYDSHGKGAARGALSRAGGMLACLLAMAALFLGMIYLLWKASGR